MLVQLRTIGGGGGELGCTRMARSAGIQDAPPSVLNSRNTSKKLPIRKRLPSGRIVCLPSDCRVGLSRIRTVPPARSSCNISVSKVLVPPASEVWWILTAAGPAACDGFQFSPSKEKSNVTNVFALE